jgi:hypothetical protein
MFMVGFVAAHFEFLAAVGGYSFLIRARARPFNRKGRKGEPQSTQRNSK